VRQGLGNQRADVCNVHPTRADLHNAGLGAASCGKDVAEIEVVRQDNTIVLTSVLHNVSIRRRPTADQ
jgi:hypothetical protein